MEKNAHWYDEQCKKLLSNKKILLQLLKREISEYKHLSDDEILKLISEPQLSKKEDGEYLETRNVEDYSIQGETIVYDVLLYAGLPDTDEAVGLIINFEAQGNMPKYSVLKRGFYYLSRLIARQKGHPFGFQKSEYSKLKKAVSIWICRTGRKRKGMLNVYTIQEESRGTEVRFPKPEYDVMQLVVISPDDKTHECKGTVEFLSLLFGQVSPAENVIERLEKEYGVMLEEREKKEVIEMCNWSMASRLDGIEEGRRKGKIEGKKEGKREGKKEGKREGRKEGTIKIAKKMLMHGESIESICFFTELPEPEVLHLKETMNAVS